MDIPTPTQLAQRQVALVVFLHTANIGGALSDKILRHIGQAFADYWRGKINSEGLLERLRETEYAGELITDFGQFLNPEDLH